jgi:hypothetical protein
MPSGLSSHPVKRWDPKQGDGGSELSILACSGLWSGHHSADPAAIGLDLDQC